MTIEHELQGIIAGGIEVKMPRYSQIERRLWVGGMPPVSCPTQFDFIINLNPGMAYCIHRHQVQVCHLMYDERILPAEKPLGVILGMVMQFLARGMVLIHCRDGLNRSPYVAALILIGKGLAPASAIELLRAKRHPAIFSNDMYEKHLLSLGKKKVNFDE